MKKVLFVFAIAAAFAACNNSGETAAAGADTAAKVDSTPAAAPVVDTTKKADSVAAPAADTTKKADTAAKKH